MKAGKLFTMVVVLGAMAGRSMAAEAFVPYRDQRADGAYVDWLEGSAGIMGRYLAEHSLKMNAYFQQAKSLAEENGRRPLLAFLKQLSIDGGRHLGDDAETFDKVKAMVGKMPAARTDVNGLMLRAFLKVPLYGPEGILGIVLPPMAEQPGAEHVGAEQSAPEAAPAAGGAHTGLILDAAKVKGASPSLLPRLVDETGRVVYGIEQVDPAIARSIGLAAFVSRVELKTAPHEERPRQGDAPLRLTAIGVTGPGNAQFVISTADADALLKETASAAFLRSCRVVIVMPPAGAPLPANGLPRAAPSPGAKTAVKPRESEKPR